MIFGYSMYVVVKAENGTSQEECLSDVHEDTASNVLFVYGLIGSECDATHNE